MELVEADAKYYKSCARQGPQLIQKVKNSCMMTVAEVTYELAINTIGSVAILVNSYWIRNYPGRAIAEEHDSGIESGSILRDFQHHHHGIRYACQEIVAS